MVTKVELWVDGVLAETKDMKFDVSGLSVGPHTIMIRSYNGASVVDEQTKNIEIYENTGGGSEGLVMDLDFTSTTGDLIDLVDNANYTVPASTVRNGSSFTIDKAAPINIPFSDKISFLDESDNYTPFTIKLRGRLTGIGSANILRLASKMAINFSSDTGFRFYMYDDQGHWGIRLSSLVNFHQEVFDIVVTSDGSGDPSGVKIYADATRIDVSTSYLAGETYDLMTKAEIPATLSSSSASTNTQLSVFRIYKGVEWTQQQVTDDYTI